MQDRRECGIEENAGSRRVQNSRERMCEVGQWRG